MRIYWGREADFTYKRYARHVLNIEDLSKKTEEGEKKTPETEIAF